MVTYMGENEFTDQIAADAAAQNPNVNQREMSTPGGAAQQQIDRDARDAQIAQEREAAANADIWEQFGISNPWDVPTAEFEKRMGEWWDTGINPDGSLRDDLVYDPTLITEDELSFIDPYDFDPTRRAAMNDLQAQQMSGYQSALTQQAAAGGLTAADRMALASSFNRGRLQATGGLLGQLGVAEAENIYETDKYNQELRNKMLAGNKELQNRADLLNIGTLDRERTRRYDIMRQMRQDEMDRAKMEAEMMGAKEQSEAQAAEAQRPTFMEELGGMWDDAVAFDF